MKRLDRYLLREMAGPMFWGIVVVTLMFQANFLIYEYRELPIESLSWIARIQVILYQTPFFLQMTIPAGVAMGGAMGISRMVRESEITIMRASGVRILRMLLPLTWVGLLAGMGEFYISDRILPEANRDFQSLLAVAVNVGAAVPKFRKDQPLKLGSLAVFIGSTSRSGTNRSVFNEILLIEQIREDAVSIIKAKSGDYDNGVFTFRDGYQWIIRGKSFDTVRSKTGDIKINQKIPYEQFTKALFPAQETTSALWYRVRESKRTGIIDRQSEIDLQTHFALPAACVVFAFVAPLLATRFARSGAVAGVILSIVLVCLYYILYMFSSQYLSKSLWLPPSVVAWSPNLLFVLAGLFSLRRLE